MPTEVLEKFLTDEELKSEVISLEERGYKAGDVLNISISYISHMTYGEHFMVWVSDNFKIYQITTCTHDQ